MTTIIADIQKDIRWDRITKDYACYVVIDGEAQYLGSRQRRMDADNLVNSFVYDYLTDTHTYETAAELVMQAA